MGDPYACINVIIYILNLKDINLNMASKFTPTFVNNFIQYLEKSLPLRIKHIHMINTPKVFQNIVKIVLSVCSEKIRKRVHIFINLYLFKLFNFICLQIYVYGTNFEEIFKIIPQKYLPKELSGENGSIKEIVKDFNKKWLEYEEYFRENANYGTNELLRSDGAIDINTLHGLEGSYRKVDKA